MKTNKTKNTKKKTFTILTAAALSLAAVFTTGFYTGKSTTSPVRVIDTTNMSERAYWDLVESRKGTILITKEPYSAFNEKEGKDQYGYFVAPHNTVGGEKMYMYCVWNPETNTTDGIVARFDYKAN